MGTAAPHLLQPDNAGRQMAGYQVRVIDDLQLDRHRASNDARVLQATLRRVKQQF
jgi:hypothetical protein